MGLKNFSIQLDNQWNTYYAGQTINGQVILILDSPKKVRGVSVKFVGEANTSWSESKSVVRDGKTEHETEHFSAHEDYFKISYYLVGGSSSEMILPVGTHTYPFTCALPPTLPSSFEGEHGHIRYTIKVTLERPWKFDQDMKMAFTVISPVDLNMNPGLQMPCKLQREKTFCCCCCRSGPLSVIVHVPVTGYVSGQSIPITCECDNASNVHVDKVNLELQKVVSFHASWPRSKTKTQTVKIAKIKVGPVEAHDSQTWIRQLQIPPLPPSNLTNCRIIDLNYQLHVEVDVSGPHINLTGHIPIILGTIPLAGFTSAPPSYTDVPIQNVNQANGGGTGGAIGWNNVNSSGNTNQLVDMPPPTFAESQLKCGSILDKDDSTHTLLVGGKDYAPRYPMCQFYPSAPPSNLQK